jgi:hypothetical protein
MSARYLFILVKTLACLAAVRVEAVYTFYVKIN